MPTSLGPAEILVILVVALIVLGPKRLPEAGRQVGKALSEVRRWSNDMTKEIKTAVDVKEPTKAGAGGASKASTSKAVDSSTAAEPSNDGATGSSAPPTEPDPPTAPPSDPARL